MDDVKWAYKIDLSDVYHSEVHSLRDKARIIANRIERSVFFEKEWTFSISDVVDGFRDLTADGGDVEDFDDIMREFYDYADTYRVWVVTR